MISATQASLGISPAKKGYHRKKLRYNTDDIIKLVMWADKRVKSDTREFAKHITPDMPGMYDLFTFVLKEIRYKADPKGAQWVKSPARLWEDRQGDCKSFTLFATSVLQNLGLDYIIRFVSYRAFNDTPTHVYPIAILPNGQEVIIDPVWAIQGGGKFNTEKEFTYKTDFKVKKGLAYLTGTDNTNDVLDTVAEIINTIPDSILQDDVTQMNEGELQRFLMAERLDTAANQVMDYAQAQNFRFAAQVVKGADLARVGAIQGEIKAPVFNFIRDTNSMTAPAFIAPTLRINIPDGVAGGLGDFFKKVGKGIADGAKAVAKGVGNAVKAVGDLFKEAWSKLMNFIFKGGLQKAAPFFLFTFMGPGALLVGKVLKRKQKQDQTLDWFKKLGMKESNINAAVKNGIIENMGAAPERVLNDYAGAKIAGESYIGIAPAVIFKAVGLIINIVKKLAALFKKNDEPQITEEDTSDLELLKGLDEPVVEPITTTNGYGSPQYQQTVTNTSGGGSSSGESGGGLAIAAMAAGAAFLFM